MHRYCALTSNLYRLHSSNAAFVIRSRRIHCMLTVLLICRSIFNGSSLNEITTGLFFDIFMIWLNLATLSLFSCDLISITGTAEYLLQQARYCFSVGMVLFLYAEALVPVIIGYFFYFLICKILYFLIHPAHALKISVMKNHESSIFQLPHIRLYILRAFLPGKFKSREEILRCLQA